MKRVFLSWYDGFLDEDCRLLREMLTRMGVKVETSPYSPHCGLGDDERWDGWYDGGLPEVVAQSDTFVACITESYDGTWMAQEFDTAANSFRTMMTPRLFVYNPHDIHLPLGFQGYLRLAEKLPSNPHQAIESLGSAE
jgi:hypothetical protein